MNFNEWIKKYSNENQYDTDGGLATALSIGVIDKIENL